MTNAGRAPASMRSSPALFRQGASIPYFFSCKPYLECNKNQADKAIKLI